MKKEKIDYKDAKALADKFLKMRRKLLLRGVPIVVANAMTATRLAFPFAGKDIMCGREWELNALIVLNAVDAVLSFKEN